MQYLLMKPAFLLAVLATATPAPTWTQIIWHDIQAATSCTACETLLKSLQQASQLGPSTLQTILTEILDADFCTGLIASQVPSAYYVLRQLSIPSDTAQTFCASVLDLCPYPPIPPINLTFPPPPLYSPITTTTNDNNQDNNITLRIAHITDTHVDLQYTPGTSTHCRKPICCRQYHAYDAPGRSKNPCSTWGSPHCDPPLRLLHNMLSTLQSQQPHLTLFTGDIVAHDIWNTSQESVLASFNETNSALHTLLNNNNPIYAAIGNHDTHPVNIFPGDANIPKELVNVEWTYTALTTDWRTLQNNPTLRTTRSGAYATTYTTTLPPTSPTQEQEQEPEPNPKIKIEIISYNSNLYYRLNLLLYTTPMPVDPMAQFTWLISELHTAEQQEGLQVLLITHIPISSKDTLPAYADALRRILVRFKDTIVGVFCGHGHVDTFGVFYRSYSSGISNGSAGNVSSDSDSDSHENQGQRHRHRQRKITVENNNNNNNNEVTVEKGEREEVVIGVEMMAPAMTPTSGYSAFRVYDVQFSCGGWKVLDFEEYVARFPPFIHGLQGDGDDSINGEVEPQWVRYYSAMEAYGKYVYPNGAGTGTNGIGAGAEAGGGAAAAGIGPHFWAKLTDVMETNWNVFNQYWARRTRGIVSLKGGMTMRLFLRIWEWKKALWQVG
ncbi:Metallo-dependent phosphatase [Aspergillus eucalypticola CBS 122712]|uniref:Metallo-dependent phosphatase n=1 Tax=Aspergillus eucalypticola (strain CBS 122712 / IBT 29274) TaxID=1448314 RepID=A0A317UN95_ASPEC|nr:Metallo-dependent phosphatase [Aspergillus eucalypticola CBS 122712]PWY63453.1 Metallo-dependent phosphatase [Aspergillus eucalypticola CBS 122712]